MFRPDPNPISTTSPREPVAHLAAQLGELAVAEQLVGGAGQDLLAVETHDGRVRS